MTDCRGGRRRLTSGNRETFIKLRTLLVALSLVASRVLDFWTTYRVTPSLRGESNPIVIILGAGWTSFVLSNAVLVAAITLAAWYAARQSPQLPARLALDYRSFVRAFWFGNGASPPWWHAWWRFPRQKRVFWCWLGAVLPPVAIAASLTASAHNAWAPREAPWNRVSFAAIYLVALVSWVVGHHWFLQTEYRRYLRLTRVREAPERQAM